MIAAGEFLALVALGGYLLFGAQGAGQANRRLESGEQAYEKWVNGFATGLGNRPAVVILEPDALAQLNTCPDNARQARLQMLSYAVKTLQTNSDQVYLDAGHLNWVPAGQMADRLRAAGVAQAYGFALNVSNYDTTDQEIGYATELDRDLGMAKRFVVDTSRNGNGSAAARVHLAAGSISRALPGAGGPIPATPGCKRSDGASRTSRQQSGMAHGAVTSPRPCRATRPPRPESTGCRSWSRTASPVSAAAVAAPPERDSGATPPAGSLVRSRKCSTTAATWAFGSRHPVSPMATAASVRGPRRASSHPSSPRI